MTSKADPPLGTQTGFSDLLGLTITELGPARVTADWDLTPAVHQPFGIVHGGAHCAVVETLASQGAYAAVKDGGGRAVGINNTTDFYRATSAGRLKAVAEAVFQGRSQQVWQVEIRDESGRLVSRGSLRLQNLFERR